MRRVISMYNSQSVMEGAGVKLKRVFGFYQKYDFDPFLLLDHFGSKNPADYTKGFPWHPHRGIETVTYMKSGEVEHKDSLGNAGVIGPGDIQWMSAGGGIIHQEMPQYNDDMLEGFQLWINMPAKSKMIAPKYREIKSNDLLVDETKDKVLIKVIAGEYNGIKGAAKDLIINCNYYDVSIPADINFNVSTPENMNYFAYVYRGSGYFCDQKEIVSKGQAVLFSEGSYINITAVGADMKVLIAGGEALNESIAWRGPIVMNTKEEIDTAFDELDKGIFIKK